MRPLLLSAYTATSCLGAGLASTLAALRAQRCGLTPCDFDSVDLPTYIGAVADLSTQRMPPSLPDHDCRNNRLAALALAQDGFTAAVKQAADRYGAERVGVFLGTSTSGIYETELAYRRRDPASGALPAGLHYAGAHNSFSLADFTRRLLGLAGPAAVVCTACSSSAKVFANAQRMLTAGVIDAALVGGVDSLCLTTLHGFHSLQLTSPLPCRPFDATRDGISIGEAAAFALLTPAPADLDADAILLLGCGESSDAYHMSSPHPDGLGARQAMQQALTHAAVSADAIDYINLHGTGTMSNDAAESRAVDALFDARTAVSSTKGATGHTLGAAGALEAVICALALREQFLPGGVNTVQVDPLLHADYLRANRSVQVQRVLSNSFGFGGANCALVFGRAG
jgi:3-oxoacyl-[acyl-carrier-protein] synthase-1